MTAIVGQEAQQTAHDIGNNPVNHGSAIAGAGDQPCIAQCRQMRRHRVVRDTDLPCDFACGHAGVTSSCKHAKGSQSVFLCQSGKCCDCGVCVHMSRIIDILIC